MSKGNSIVVSASPICPFEWGYINDTSLPGTIMQIEAGKAFAGNTPYVVANNPGTDGAKCVPMILREDKLQGGLITDAGVAGKWREVYCLLSGDMFLGRFGEAPGTGTAVEIGDRLILDAEDGVLIPEVGTTTAEDCFAVALEAISYSADSSLLWCMKT